MYRSLLSHNVERNEEIHKIAHKRCFEWTILTFLLKPIIRKIKIPTQTVYFVNVRQIF